MEDPSHDSGVLGRPALLVSACLLGVACTHTGESKLNARVQALAGQARLVAVCPEVAGGLSTPRPEAAVGPDGRVRTVDGEDVTGLFERGATHTVALARSMLTTKAVMKARSPSCGNDGVTTAALRAAGIEVVSEEDL